MIKSWHPWSGFNGTTKEDIPHGPQSKIIGLLSKSFGHNPVQLCLELKPKNHETIIDKFVYVFDSVHLHWTTTAEKSSIWCNQYRHQGS